ncbi:hypothetical protein EDB85DRAFT_1895604 [Lactarius pseudohatsudake]|nr:hypothetical protein EDB85DRAFT_1895604 [Lactarius pseudohatsudake]
MFSHWMMLVPRPSKTRALENAAWRRLKPKTYPKKIPNLATTDPRTTKVNVPPPKKKHRSNTDTFLTAVDSELPVEDPNDEETNEAPRCQAHTTTTNNLCKVPPHLERRQKALPHSSEDEFGPEDKSQDDDNKEDKDNEEDADNEDLFRLDNEALRQTFDNEGPLSKRATDQWAELVVLSDNNYGAPPASATALSAERNARWPHAPICPPGPRQRNLLISLQPEDFKAILKEGIQSLHHYCAFRQGYIPVDAQTDLFIELLIKTATKLNKPHYGARLQKDVVLQKEVCDLLSGRISHYRTTIKQVAVNFVSHGYKLENDESMRVRQVKDLINNDKFIFEPKDDGGINSTRPFQHPVIIDTLRAAFFKRKRGSTFAQKNRRCFPLGVSSVVLELPPAMVAIVAVAVHASLEEKAYEIKDNNKPAYRRLMSDLYKLVTDDPKTRVRDSSSNAMVLLDLNGMAV